MLVFEALDAFGDRMISEFTDPGNSDLVLFPQLLAQKGNAIVQQLGDIARISEGGSKE